MDVDYGILLGSIGIITGTVSLLYARSSAVGTHRQADSAEQTRREAAAMAVITTFHTPEFSDLILAVTQMGEISSKAEFEAQTPESQRARVAVTQRLEMLGVLVADRVIDIDLVEKTLGSFVLVAWSKMEGVARLLREESGDPTIAEYFQWLAERLEARATHHLPAYVALKDWTPA